MRTSKYSIALAIAVLVLFSAARVPAQATRGPGTAIRFDGSGEHIKLNGPSLTGGNALTLEVWVRPNPTQGGGTLLWTGGGLRLAFCQGTDLLCFEILVQSGYQVLQVSTSSVDFSDALWHHVAATYDGETMAVYLDGSLVGSKSVTGTLLVWGPRYLGLMVHGDNSYTLGFPGSLDEVRIWSIARSQTEIRQAMNRPLLGNETGLEGYYRLDEGTAGIAHDSSGRGRDGQLINFYVGPYDGNGWIASTVPLGQPLTYTLSPMDVTTNSATLRGIVNPFGAETVGWFEWGIVGQPANIPTPTNHVGSGTEAVPVSFTLTNLLSARYYAYHCIATNASGSVSGSNYFFHTLGKPIVNTTAASDFSPTGARLNGALIPNGFETAAWFEYGLTTNYGNRTALTPVGAGTSQVNVSNLVSDFAPLTTVYYRLAASNSLGTAYGPDVAFSTLGPANTALNFNGITGLVGLPVVSFSSTNKLTLEAWVAPRAIQRPVLCQWMPGNPPVWTLLFGAEPTLGFGLWTTAGYQRMDASLVLPGYAGGPWHHIAVTYDGSFMRLYHNAKLLSSKAMTGSYFPLAATTNAIGFGPEGPFNGQIDEVRIWSGARTLTEIEQGRFRRLTGTEPFLMAYWRLDEGAGTIAADSSGHGWTGTLSGGPQWLPSGVPLGVPFAQADAASLVEPDAAVLNGLVNPCNFATTAWFEWGTDTNCNITSQVLDLGSSGMTFPITHALSGLMTGTTYYFRVAAANTNGTARSAGKTFILGPSNKALKFSGADDYVRLPPLNFSGGNKLTLEAWIKPEAITDSSAYNIIRQETAYYVPSYSRDWLLALYGNTLSFGLNTGLPYPNAFPVLTAAAAPGRFDDGRWHHVAATYDGSMKRLFLDGVEMAATVQTGNIVNSGNACAIGAMAWGAGEFFRGAIEEVRIWNVARSQAQIIQTMNQPLVGNETGLLAYLPFNEGTGDSTTDQSGHLAAGQLMGSPARVVSDALNRAVCVTLPVTNLSNVTAELNAAANPAALPMRVWFEWGTTTNYGQTTVPQAVGSGQFVSQMLSGLAAGTDYHCRTVASNANEVIRSLDVAFRTSGPQVQTLPPMALTAISMAVRGMVNARWIPAQIWFEWGTNVSYGFSTPPQTGYGNDHGYTYSHALTNLTPGQTYHYRIMATNNGGLATGQDMQFTPSFAETFSGIGDSWYGNSHVSWGDSDRDGDLDLLLLAGINTNIFTTLYRNDGGPWASLPAYYWSPGGLGLPHVSFGSADWGDYDHDGDLDLLITGTDSRYYPPTDGRGIFRNEGGNLFTNAVAGPPPIGLGGGAWADYDNDGHLDFIMVGADTTDFYQPQPTNVLARGDGRGGFVKVNAGLPALINSAVAWGDYDNDGQLDLLIAGDTSAGLITRVYHNNGGLFTDIGAGLPGVAFGSVAWGDHDEDGWLDILLAGTMNSTSNGAVCKIFRNEHDGTFTEIQAGLPGVFKGTAAWGDYDNDGQLDVLLTGTADNNGSLAARVFHNDHGNFTELAAGLSASTAGSGAWGDFDGDGKLDIAVIGTGALSYYAGNTARVFQNLIAPTNLPPNAPSSPTGLTASVLNNAVTLQWLAATDPHTPAPGLTYNVRVGTTPGGGQIVPPQSDPASGRRRLPDMGNAEHRLFLMLTNLPVGFYYWSVQAVNHSFVGSPWASEQIYANLQRPSVLDVALQTAPATPGAFLRFGGSPGSDSIVETSTNLTDWLALTNLAAGPDGLFEFLDISATNHPTRFYRLRVP